MARETGVQKMVLDSSLLNTQHYKGRIKGKEEQPGKEVAPFPTPRYRSFWKGSLRVAFDYSRQYFLKVLDICIDQVFRTE